MRTARLGESERRSLRVVDLGWTDLRSFPQGALANLGRAVC